MAAPTKPAVVKILLANPEPSTHGPSATSLGEPGMSAFGGVERTCRRHWLRSESDPKRSLAYSCFAYRDICLYISFRLDIGRSDHLTPLLGLFNNQLPEVRGRAFQQHCVHFGNPNLHF
jgi:hypothetical protein